MAITATERTQIIELTTLMFNAAPGATYLSQIVALYEGNGRSLSTLAAQLAQTTVYTSLNPSFQTSAEFAAKLLTPLGLQNDDIAKTFVTSKLDAGVSKAAVVYAAFQALNGIVATDAAIYQTAKTILLNKTTVAEYYSATLLGSATDLATLQTVISSVTADPASVTQAQQDLQSVTGVTINLTTAAEEKTGTAGNDTFNGSDTTLVLDVLNGDAGIDTLSYSDAKGGVNINSLGLTLNGVEVIEARSTGASTLTTTGFSGVTDVNVQLSTAATVTAAAATNVAVSGTTGAITINGGANVTVSDSTADMAITIGGTTSPAGNVTVTDTNVGTGAIYVDGGKAVSLALTGAVGGSIKVGTGGAASDLPSGAVTITSANKAVAGVDKILDDITVVGGSTVSVTESATSSLAATDATGATVTQGNVTITGGTATTTVSVAQTKSAAKVVGATAAAGTTETSSVKFGALKSGDVLTLDADGSGGVTAGDLTFTAAKDLTAAQVAAVFASLTKGDTQGGATAGQGTYTGTLSGWTSGAVSTDTVVFSSTAAGNPTDLGFVLVGAGAAPVATPTQGVAATVAVTGVLGVVNGTVVIDDNATAASITSVSVDGYGNASTIGATNTLSKLANLSLANSGSTGTAGETDATMTVDAAGVASLNVTVNAIKGAVSLDGAADNALKTLSLTTAGSKSSFALTAAAVETLSVAGTTSVSLTADLAALKTVTVSGAAGLTLASSDSDTLTSVNTSATTGKVTATIDGGKATYTGGAGQDSVTLATTTALTKAIDLGAGDDTLSFAALNVSGSTAALNGGDGTDTLSMSTVAADLLDASTQTFYTNFERLTLNNVFGTADGVADALTVNLANLGFTNYVTTSGTQVNGVGVATATDVLTLDKMATAGTVVLKAQGSVAVNVTNAATGTADVLNAVVTADAGVNAGTLTVANVEAINLTNTDSLLDNNGDGVDDPVDTNSLILTAGAATAVTIAGNANLNLTMTGSTKVTSIDGSAMTGKLDVTSLNITSATTINGGSGNDTLTAAAGSTADVLNGGAGNDTLTANGGLDVLTGGAGSDTFVIGTASLNVNSYATITDFGAGDLIKITGADSFQASKVTLGDTAVFQDYANAAMNALPTTGDVAWFQFGGNTYIVMDAAATNSTAFINGEDVIVKLTGLVDLSTASFNDTTDTISL